MDTITYLYSFINTCQILPEILLATAIVSFLTYGVYAESLKKDGLIELISYASIVVLFIALILVYRTNGFTGLQCLNLLVIDPLTQLVKGMVLIGSIFSLIISLPYFKNENIRPFEYPILILFATLGLMLFISAWDLIIFYLALELQSLTLYVLAAIKRNSEFSTEAGLKYFILGAFSSGLLLFGIVFLYGFTGITSFQDFTIFFISPTDCSMGGVSLGLLFIGVALLFKSAAAPFHMWAPDVYEGAPTSVTAFFAITPKIALFVLLIRFYMMTFYNFGFVYTTLLTVCAILSMSVGAIGALFQTNLKRLLAYSAIGHVGYMLIGLTSGSILGIQAVVAYSIIYMLTTVGAFGVVLSLYNKHTGLNIKYISHLRALGKTHPALAAALTVTMFSLAGIPPLAGFYGKLFLFLAAIEQSMYLLAIFGVLTSVIGAFYYIRIIKVMYFYDVDNETPMYHVIPKLSGLVIGISALFVCSFFVDPSPLLETVFQIITQLFAG